MKRHGKITCRMEEEEIKDIISDFERLFSFHKEHFEKHECSVGPADRMDECDGAIASLQDILYAAKRAIGCWETLYSEAYRELNGSPLD